MFLKLYTIIMPRYEKQHFIDFKLQTLSLVEIGIVFKKIAWITDINTSIISRLRKKTRDGGYNSEKSIKLNIKQMKNRFCIEWFAIIITNKKTFIVNFITKNKLHQKMNVVEIISVYNVFATIILKILKRNKLKFCKNIKKPTLTVRMKTKWLKWCIEHENWILNDWKNIIWTNKTNIILNQIQNKRKIWKKINKIYVKSIIRHW